MKGIVLILRKLFQNRVQIIILRSLTNMYPTEYTGRPINKVSHKRFELSLINYIRLWHSRGEFFTLFKKLHNMLWYLNLRKVVEAFDQ